MLIDLIWDISKSLFKKRERKDGLDKKRISFRCMITTKGGIIIYILIMNLIVIDGEDTIFLQF